MPTFFQFITRSTCIIAVAAFLGACGGGGGSSNSSSSTEVIDTLLDDDTTMGNNVALMSNGATVSSTFSGNELFVIDGDITTDNFWAPGASDDSVTIDFGALYDLEEIVIRNDGLTSNAFFDVELSDNGTDFRELNIFDDCSTLRLGSLFFCSLVDEARYIRLTILTTAIDIEVHEIEVIEF